MKELSIAGKATRYDEALKEAVIAHKDEDRHLKATLERIFPELKESEDEKIRKALIRFHKSTIDIDGIKGEDILAWLEKQGEKGINGNEREIPNSEQKPVDKVEPKFKVGCVIQQIKPHDNIPLRVVYIGAGSYQCESDDLKISCSFPIKEQDDWELIEQKPAEWSEEDENIRQWVISDIEKLLALHKKSSVIADKEINWLKSLKERYTWKPSDEHYELEEFAKIVRCNLTGVSKAVQKLFEAKYLQLTGNKMYGGFKD